MGRNHRVNCSPKDEEVKGGSGRDRRDDRFEDGTGLTAHFLVVSVLDRVIHQHVAGALHAQRLALDLGGLGELAGGDGDGGKPLDLEPYSVVQTARRA